MFVPTRGAAPDRATLPTRFAAIVALAAAATLGGVIANADAPSDACDSAYTESSINALKRYNDCRFDRLEQQLAARSPVVPGATTSPSVTARPSPSPSAQPSTTPRPTASPKPSETPKPTPTSPVTKSAANRVLGPTKSGLPWHSGAWIGGRFTADHLAKFGAWRGRSADMVTTYSPRASYKAMTDDTWSITTWNGFAGKLSYGLAPLPDSGEGSLVSIAAGQQDQVWRKVAQNLKAAGRGDSVVRIGWELNLKDWRWNVTTSNAEQYKSAYRRIATTMRAEAPALKFEFGIGCGTGLRGSTERLAPLNVVYPGDDVVDLIGCDTYDWWNTHAKDERNWSNVLAPADGPGIQDVADFARSHGKGASYAEWGLARASNGNGGGDNPFYIAQMHSFFSNNRDVVAFECYFDEPDSYIANSLFGSRQNPNAAEKYAELW